MNKINEPVISLNIARNYFRYLPKNTDYFSEAMIDDLNDINSFTEDAFSWFVGQFFGCFSLNQDSANYILKKRSEIKIKKPYLG